MNFGFNAGISGLRTATNRLNIAANNIANVETPGFKKIAAIIESRANNQGSAVTSTKIDQSPGASLFTGNALDIAIQGNGFFNVTTPNGKTGYTRVGLFGLDNQRRITDTSGNVLQPEITVPADASSISISQNGEITTELNGQEVSLGRINISSFNNPAGLMHGGSGIFYETANSGPATSGRPGSGGLGSLMPSSLEGSNVDIAEEMVDLILAKHAFSASIKAIQTADEMTKSTLDIKA